MIAKKQIKKTLFRLLNEISPEVIMFSQETQEGLTFFTVKLIVKKFYVLRAKLEHQEPV